ncbi:MAG: PatB family C-S lyase [Actinobacteria bacterium]|nr:PatB family C-S lyase [Actinomycetota bacterium]
MGAVRKPPPGITPPPSPDFDRLVDRTGTASLKWGLYGQDVLPLWVADMDFEAPAPVIEAVETFAAHGVYGYARMPDSLLEAITTYLATEYSWPVHPDWIVYTPGVVPALNVVCRAYAGLGEGVMTLTPAYPPFLEAPPNQERHLQTVSARLDEEGRWRMPLEKMERVVDPSTRVLLFCHPHNPLGRAWERAELELVVDFCRRHDLVLCSDEIHCDLLLDPVEHVPATLIGPDAEAFTVTLMSPSKSFNVPGLNFAYAVIPDARLRQAFKQAARGLFSLPGCFSVVVAEACYRQGDPWLSALLEYLRVNRDLVEEWAAGLGSGVTTTHVEATYLAWLDVHALGSKDPAADCVAAGVGLSDGRAFGTPGFLRLNFGCPRSTLVEALRRLDGVLG